MKLNLQKFALAVAALLAFAVPASAQHYPMPVRDNQAPAVCTDCMGNNAFGVPNKGLKTWQYSEPLVKFVGRAVDSTTTDDYQDRGGGTGFRTARAGKMLVADQQRGAAPPRVYLQLGPAIAAYSIDRFFTTTLPSGPVPLSTLVPWGRSDRNPSETVAKWEMFIQPEHAESGWTTPIFDGQDRMFDFDVDDRGLLYAATGGFGWGIVRDTGGSGIMPLVKQMLTEDSSGVTPSIVISLKVDGRYYAVTSNSTDAGTGRAVHEVTTPSSPSLHRTPRGAANAILAWAKHDASKRIAVVTGESKIAIYDYAAFVNGAGPIETFTARSGFTYADVTVDDNGNFWTGEYTNKMPGATNLIRFSPSGGGYSANEFGSGSGGFSIAKINYSDKYIVANGMGTRNGLAIELRVFKMENDQPVPVDLGEFFTYYYHRVPSADYAQPPQSTTSTMVGGHVVKAGGKTYLVYNIDGLSDVFELQTGDSISGTLKSGTAGTPNPNSRPDGSGPFYSDPLRFTSKSSNPSFEYNVEWDFDNPEAGSDNLVSSRTPQEVVHQYTGLSTSTKVTATKSVLVSVPGNSEMSDTVQVSMVLPKARVGISGATTLIDVDGKTLDVVLGDEFTDASDGTIEGHYAAWTIDSTTTNLLPNQTIAVGDFGTHTASMAAKYGKYDTSFATVGSPYVDTISGLTYTVRPFVAAFAPASISGSQVTFKATARTGAITGLASWNVEWTLKTSTGADVVPAQSGPATFGTVTPFVVADRNAIPSGSILSLTVSVDPSLLDASAANVAAHTISQTLLTPDPKITRSGCLNTGAPCSFTLSSIDGNPMDAWDIVWTLKRDGSTVATSSANPFTPTISNPGRYTISVVAKTDLFEGTASLTSWDAEGPICSDPPTSSQLSIYASCDTCPVNSTVTIKPDAFGYAWQDCEEFIWNFGDGSTLTTTDFTVTHKYTSTGKKTIKLKVKKGTQTSPEVSYQITIGSTSEPPPPPPTCAVPLNIQVTYSGSKGCRPGVDCKTGEKVTFTASRLSTALLSCDTATWTFHDDSTTTLKSPSKTYSSPGSYSVSVEVSNSLGTATPVSTTVKVVQDTSGTCGPPPTADQVYVTYRGRTSGCNDGNPSMLCSANEIIDFSPGAFLGYSFQGCDRYEWDFGDGSAKSAEMDSAHTYANPAAAYAVKLRVYNQTNSTGTTFSVNVPFSNVPAKPTPVLSFAGFPATGSKGNAVTFTVNSNIAATGWSWDFGDGKKETQPTHVGTSSTITHVYANTGTFTVTVKARNAAETLPVPPTGSATGQIVVDEIPEFRYLLPVVIHAPGQGGSVWRTDVQIYNPDPNVSATNTLDMTASFNGQQTQLHVAHSTYVFEDFMQRLTTADISGPVLITTKAKYAPQIWTRTYNQADNGTFGQFIPAIRLDAAGGGSAVGEGRYFLAGLRNDARYRTNIGLVNPTAQQVTATIRAFDEAGLPIANGVFTETINPFQLVQFGIGSKIQDFPSDRAFSLEVEVGTGQWVIAYASFIDGGSNDPVFIQAVRESELVSEDYRTLVIPGVGHTGAWRSDVAIFNSNGRGITIDLAYHDASGAKVAETTNIPIGGGEFLLFEDILKEGILGSEVPDGLGMLRVTVPPSVSAERFPMAFDRTYNDDGSGKTYGQGIAGFAAARPNVSATTTGLIPAVRSKDGEYYTNVFVTNVTDAAVMFSIKVLDRTTGAQIREVVETVGPYQTFAATKFDLGGESASLKIQATGNVWAYASVVDDRTKDPEYVPAVPIAP